KLPIPTFPFCSRRRRSTRSCSKRPGVQPVSKTDGYRRRGSGLGGGGADLSSVLDAAAAEDLSRAGVCRDVALAGAVWAALRASEEHLRVALTATGTGGSRATCRGDLISSRQSTVIGRQETDKQSSVASRQ